MKYLLLLTLLWSASSFADCFSLNVIETVNGDTLMQAVLTPNYKPLEQCTEAYDFWIPNGTQVSENPPVAENEQINRGFNSAVMALAMCCFFLGMNSWEPSAK